MGQKLSQIVSAYENLSLVDVAAIDVVYEGTCYSPSAATTARLTELGCAQVLNVNRVRETDGTVGLKSFRSKCKVRNRAALLASQMETHLSLFEHA